MTIVASEQKHVFIGDDCLFARNIFFRTADSHLIYDIDSSMRISTPRSVFVGDHVWIGQNALLLKGTQLGSGSIIGAASVVAGKRLSSNCAYAGNPVHKVREGVWFSSASTHAYTEQDARKAERNGSAKWVYKFSQAEAWPFEALEAAFAATYSVDEKIAYLNGINSAVSHNRFVIP
jgi:carbonic anhydrase/acetyltransferase-like protein (isoleucine patch superfamily)